MSNPEPVSPDTDRLIGKLVDGLLDPEQTRGLETLLKSNEAARGRYCDLVMLHSLLQWRTMGSEMALALGDDDQPAATDLHAAMILPAIRIDEPIVTGQPSPGSPMGPMGGPSLEDLEIPAAREGMAKSVPVASGTTSHPRWNFIRMWYVAASVLVVASLAAVITSAVMRERSHAADVATLTGTIDARWDDAPAGLGDGAVLPLQQVISLQSGWAELAYPNGVVVTIEGPARFSIRPGQELSLERGKLVALVSKAGHGFAVTTPCARVVDLGTEFGVAVGSTGETDVDTFRGTVSLTPTAVASDSASTLISAGFARRVSSTGAIAEVPINENAFVRPQQFADWNSTHPAGYESWRAYSERLRHDPDLVAYYTFNKAAQSPDRLLNQSSLGSALDGVLTSDKPGVRPAWTTGRWPEKGALEFSGSDNPRVVVASGRGDPLDFSRGQQTASPMTIAGWIRPEAEENAAIAAKGASFSEQFALETGRAWVRQTPGNANEPLRRVLTPPAGAGVWSQLVFTYDPIGRNTRLYRNGVLIGYEESAPARLLQTEAPMTIGCRPLHLSDKPGKPPQYIGAFHGCMDELLIMKRAMSADEVREMFRIGKPG